MKLLIIYLLILIVVLSAGFYIKATKAEYDKQFEAIEVEVTAYSPSPHITQGNPFQMASGRIAKPSELEQLRYIAVSRDLIEKYNLKWGDVVWIGFELQDTMNKKVETGVDLFMRNMDLARKFGRQNRTIIVERR